MLKKISVLSLLLPSVFSIAFLYLEKTPFICYIIDGAKICIPVPFSVFIGVTLACYIFTILGLVWYVRTKPFNPWLLLLGLALCPLWPYIYETLHKGMVNYLATLMVLYFYTLPFCFVSTVMALTLPKQVSKDGNSETERRNQD